MIRTYEVTKADDAKGYGFKRIQNSLKQLEKPYATAALVLQMADSIKRAEEAGNNFSAKELAHLLSTLSDGKVGLFDIIDNRITDGALLRLTIEVVSLPEPTYQHLVKLLKKRAARSSALLSAYCVQVYKVIELLRTKPEIIQVVVAKDSTKVEHAG